MLYTTNMYTEEYLLDLLCAAVNEADEWYEDSWGRAPITTNSKLNTARQILQDKGYPIKFPKSI